MVFKNLTKCYLCGQKATNVTRLRKCLFNDRSVRQALSAAIKQQ